MDGSRFFKGMGRLWGMKFQKQAAAPPPPANLVPNGTFSDTTGVTLNAGSGGDAGQPAPTVTGGVLDFQGKGNAVETLSSPLAPGTSYTITFDIPGNDGGTDMGFSFGTAGSFTQTAQTSGGVTGQGLTLTFTANAAHAQIRFRPADQDSPIQLDNITLKAT